MMLQHCPTDVTGFGGLVIPVENGADGTAYDSQYPRQAFVSIVNCTQSGISILRIWPTRRIRIRTKIKNLLIGITKNTAQNCAYVPTLWQPGRCHILSFENTVATISKRRITWSQGKFLSYIFIMLNDGSTKSTIQIQKFTGYFGYHYRLVCKKTSMCASALDKTDRLQPVEFHLILLHVSSQPMQRMRRESISRHWTQHLRPFATEIVAYVSIVTRPQGYEIYCSAQRFNHSGIMDTKFLNIQYLITVFPGIP